SYLGTSAMSSASFRPVLTVTLAARCKISMPSWAISSHTSTSGITLLNSYLSLATGYGSSVAIEGATRHATATPSPALPLKRQGEGSPECYCVHSLRGYGQQRSVTSLPLAV